MAFKLIIPAFNEGATIPTLHTCDGADISPSIEWSGEPKETKSFALIVDDPDAPAGTWTHWLLYDIPASTHALPQGYKPGQVGVSGTNDFGRPGYGGPCPPKGNGPHRYFFRPLASRLGPNARNWITRCMARRWGKCSTWGGTSGSRLLRIYRTVGSYKLVDQIVDGH